MDLRELLINLWKLARVFFAVACGLMGYLKFRTFVSLGSDVNLLFRKAYSVQRTCILIHVSAFQTVIITRTC